MTVQRFSLPALLLAALTVFPVALHAQKDAVLLEEFKNNQRGWMEIDNANVSAKVAKGVYAMTFKTAGYPWIATRSVFIDPTQDYRIEASIRQVSGAEDGAFGLVWGSSSNGNINAFVVTTDGQAKVAAVRNNSRQRDLQPGAQAKAIKPLGQYNKIVIEKQGENIKFMVNGEVAATTPSIDFVGTEVGIAIVQPMSVDVDRLVVTQKQKINLAPGIPKKIVKTNLGPNVNSTYDEINPVISSDGSTLYFSSRNNPENTGGAYDMDEIWMSKMGSDSTWGKRERLGRPLNNEAPNSVILVTPDNNTLLLANQYGPNGMPKGRGLSLSHRTSSGWSVPEDVNVRNLVNNSEWYQFCLSSDRKVLLMSLAGNDTYGLHDLYVSFLQSDGTWSEQKNLGAVVNSFGNEVSPFLAADGTTLFYSSNGKPGYGESDIYVTRRLDDSWTNWSEPQNLGPTINTVGNDSYFTMAASGAWAYMLSSTNSLGGTDIFRMRLPESLRPRPIVLVYGRVLNSKTGQPIGADITYRDLTTDKEIGIASSNPADGSYKIALPAGKVYSFMAEQKGFYAVSDNLDLKNLKDYREIKRDLLLAPIEVGATIRLNNIFFDSGESTLREESFPELKRVVEFMQDNPSMAIEVAGHTDNVGADAANRTLSENRAHTVMEYLASQGIPASRMTSKGYGKSKPVASNDTDDGRQQNRRVEFTIVR